MTITSSISVGPSTTYLGQTWYDHLGQPIEEVGHSFAKNAAEKIAATDRALTGRWCFAVVKAKTIENGIERWATAVVFPDGKSRRLVVGEVALSQRSKGTFISLELAKQAAVTAKVTTEIRPAPDTRFPWHNSAAETRMERFATMIDFERWLQKNNRPESVIFLFEPGKHVRPPDEEALFAYLVSVPK